MTEFQGSQSEAAPMVDTQSPLGSSRPAVETYSALDLSPGSILDRALQDAVENEQCEGGRCHLTDEIGSDPAGLTPQMQGWLGANITPLRGPALAEVKAAFEGDNLSPTQVGKGVLVPAELASLERTRLAAYARVHSDFRRNRQTLLDRRDDRAVRFEQMRAAEDMREPHMTPVWYFAALFIVVVLESLINFESLLQLPFITSPAYALGMTILVGLAVGSAAHIHGEILKQWDYYFGQFDNTRAWQGWRNFGIGTFLLVVSVGLVGWSRYFYILPQLLLAEQTGAEPPSVILSIAFMTASNIVVYGVGAYLSYRVHDPNPEYPRAKVELDKAQAALDRVTAGVNAELKRIDARHAQQVERVNARDKAQRSAPNYADNCKLLAKVQAADERVEAALARYKTTLVKSMRGRKDNPQFVQDRITRDDAARVESLTAEAFLGRPIKLRM